MADYDYADIDRFYKDLGWDLGESEVVDIQWAGQFRDFTVQLEAVRPAEDNRPANVRGSGFDRAVAGRLLFQSAAHVTINRPQRLALGIGDLGEAYFTIVAIWRNQPIPQQRDDLIEGDWQVDSIFADDGTHKPWISVVCKSCRFEPAGAV